MTLRLQFLIPAVLALAACATPDPEPAATPPRQIAALRIADQGNPPLPLRVPIKGVMAGIIDFSAHGIFTTATSETPLTDSDWLAAGLASINLISSATLITSAGAGPDDEAWVANPEWRHWAAAYQEASVDAAVAIRRKDRAAFLSAANDLANTCQSCHDRFRITDQRSRGQYAEQMAPRGLKDFVRAWPQPGS